MIPGTFKNLSYIYVDQTIYINFSNFLKYLNSDVNRLEFVGFGCIMRPYDTRTRLFFSSLKVVGNEKGGGSGSRPLLE